MSELMAETARNLRQRQTKAEEKLWARLKNRQLCGAKFRRQEPVVGYIVDFVSFEEKIVLELDGSPHRETEAKIVDMQRTSWLRGEGFKVLRFWNNEVINDIEKVLIKVEVAISPSPDLSHQGRGIIDDKKSGVNIQSPLPSVGEE